MIKKRLSTLLFALTVSATAHAAPLPVTLDSHLTLWDAIANGKSWMDFRFRYEAVSGSGDSLKNAFATTLRTKWGYQTGVYRGLLGVIEANNVIRFSEDYDAGGGNTPSKAGVYHKIADPIGTDLIQAYVQFSPNRDWTFHVGRQKVILDNGRFVGNTAFRQHEQTFDGVTVQTNVLPMSKTFVGYIIRANRIFGATALNPYRRYDSRSVLGNVQYHGLRWGALTVYGYFIDNLNERTTSTRTVGASLVNYKSDQPQHYIYRIEYAGQRNDSNNPLSYGASYYHVMFGMKWQTVLAKVGCESMGGSRTAGKVFQFPFGDAHKFNGWTDKFSTTPALSLKDLYIGYRQFMRDFYETNFIGEYHKYSFEKKSTTIGNEIDLKLEKHFAKYYDVSLAYAHFQRKYPGFNTQNKWWLTMRAFFS